MFGAAAPRYDLLNHLLSGALDFVWRRAAAREIRDASGEPVLDLCCGTGDQAVTLEKHGRRVVAADFCIPMLALARPKGIERLAAGDALSLPFPDDTFSAATVSFGLRNVVDLDEALAEIARVLVPGGKLVVLECTLPRRQPVKGLYRFYFERVLPKVGSLLSPNGSAYSYLPASVREFPEREAFTARMLASGFSSAGFRDLSLGAICMYSGRTPE